MVDTVKSVSTAQVPRWLAAVNHTFRGAATVSLPFTALNLFRDPLMAYVSSPLFKSGPAGVANFAKHWGKGLFNAGKFELLGKSELLEGYVKNRGSFGILGELRSGGGIKDDLFAGTTLDKAKDVAKMFTGKEPIDPKVLKSLGADVITSPFTLVEKISVAVEMSTRLGVYSRGLELGLGKEAAGYAGRKASINFSAGGTFSKVANQFGPFLNARMQVAANVFEAFKNRPVETASKVFTTVTMPAVGLYAWNRMYFSKEYDDIPQNIKDQYFTLIYGKEKNDKGRTVPKYFAIPKGEYGAIGANLVEYGLDQLRGQSKESFGKFIVGYLGDLSPVSFMRQGEFAPEMVAGSLMPPVAKGLVENWANLSFYTGRPIVNTYDRENKPPELQYGAHTPESYKWLGQKLNMSPSMIQNLAASLFAGYGRDGGSPQAMLRGITGRLVKTTGGEIQNRAFATVFDIEEGYKNARAFAEEMVKNGKRKEADKLLRDWNKGLEKQIKAYDAEFSQYDLSDRGGLKKSYLFNTLKRRNILNPKKEKGTFLERKLKR
jgi:hypothetical protein